MIWPIVISIGVTVVVLGLGGVLTEVGPWYHGLHRPSWNPPDWLFAPAWTVIGALVAWSAVIAWRTADNVDAQLLTVVLFAINGVLNAFWSALFFKFRRPDWALAEVVALFLSIVALIVAFAGRAPLAAWLLAPYLCWVGFASCLNLTIVRLNGPFGGAAAGRRGLVEGSR